MCDAFIILCILSSFIWYICNLLEIAMKNIVVVATLFAVCFCVMVHAGPTARPKDNGKGACANKKCNEYPQYCLCGTRELVNDPCGCKYECIDCVYHTQPNNALTYDAYGFVSNADIYSGGGAAFLGWGKKK